VLALAVSVLLLPVKRAMPLTERHGVFLRIGGTAFEELANRLTVEPRESGAILFRYPRCEARVFVRAGAADRLQIAAPAQRVEQCAAQIVTVSRKGRVQEDAAQAIGRDR